MTTFANWPSGAAPVAPERQIRETHANTRFCNTKNLTNKHTYLPTNRIRKPNWDNTR